MRYTTPSGREFTLAYHGLAEWADARKAALLYLGCSEEYAETERREIAEAVRPD